MVARGCVRMLIDEPCDGLWNMAVDEALLRVASGKRCGITVRLYRWKHRTVSLGYFSVPDEMFVERCFKTGVDVVRRISGGGAVLHDDEVTYSIIVPRDAIKVSSVLDAYKQLADGVIRALHRLGVDAHFRFERACGDELRRPMANQFCYSACSPVDIVVMGSLKLVGNAQARFKGSILQHGSLPLSWDRKTIESLFGDTASNGCFVSLEDVLTVRPSYEEVIESLQAGFEEALMQPVCVGKLSDEERELASKIAMRKSAVWRQAKASAIDGSD
ncbi:MAG: hypothetical protein HZRFUVUK_001626 [Candidatus Fervidibacterota bacterium]